jgi:two-component system, chemotaxis family, chemotaxis protein CheY
MPKVMIVDDSPVVRKVVHRVLEGMHLAVYESDGADEPLALCARVQPDVVLVDANMPDIDGFDFVRALRSAPGGDQPIVILCLTETSVAQIARARHLGADDVMLKPFDGEAVRRKFLSLLLLPPPARA